MCLKSVIMIKSIISNLKNIFAKDLPIPLGRWNIDYRQLNSKVDLSNEDHCGPCGEYALTKKDTKNAKPL